VFHFEYDNVGVSIGAAGKANADPELFLIRR